MTHATALDTAAVVAALRRIVPPTALIDVGIGRGTGAMHQWLDWDVSTAWLIDAEPTQIAWAEPLTEIHPRWHVCSVTLAETDGDTQYYRASNPAETGLVPTSNLTALWPNLHQAEQSMRRTTRLDTLLGSRTDLPDSPQCWLIVDCLPALRVLQGATNTLERCSVLWLRTLLRPLPESVAGTALEELEAFLAPLGFRCVQASEGNHPALGDSLFVRDWAQRLQPVIAELKANNEQHQHQAQLLENRLAAHEASAKAALQKSETQAKMAATRQTQLVTLEAEKVELVDKLSAAEKARTELASKLAAVEKECTAKGEALATAQSEATTSASERDAQAKLVAERQAKLDAVMKEKTDLNGKFDALSKTHAELADKLAVATQKQSETANALETTHLALVERTGERDTQSKLVTDYRAKLAAFAEEKDELIGRLNALGKTNIELNDKLTASTQQQSLVADLLKTAQTALSECTGQRDAQAKLATERQAEIDVHLKEKSELAAKIEGQTKLAGERQIQLDTIGKEKAVLTTDYQTKIEAFVKEKADLISNLDGKTKLAAERQATLATLAKEKDELIARLNAFSKANTELNDKLAASTQQQSLTADSLKTAQTALSERTGQRDAQAKLATERQAKIDALAKEKSELVAKLNEQTKLADERQVLLDTIGKEKATLTEKLAAADKARQESSQHNDSLKGQTEQLTKARDEQAKLASEHSSQISQLTSQLGNLSKENQVLKSDIQGKDAAVAKLNEQVTEQDQRERQLVEEIVRAEAQIELIKDLLLREGGL